MEAEAPLDVPADALPEVETEKLSNILVKVKAEAPVDALEDKLTDVDAESLRDHWPM